MSKQIRHKNDLPVVSKAENKILQKLYDIHGIKHRPWLVSDLDNLTVDETIYLLYNIHCKKCETSFRLIRSDSHTSNYVTVIKELEGRYVAKTASKNRYRENSTHEDKNENNEIEDFDFEIDLVETDLFEEVVTGILEWSG